MSLRPPLASLDPPGQEGFARRCARGLETLPRGRVERSEERVSSIVALRPPLASLDPPDQEGFARRCARSLETLP